MDCIFCKIAKKEIQPDIVFENERLISFKDVNPKAPVHILIIPKKHIESINELADGDIGLVKEMIITAKKITKDLNISDGYKLLFNVGEKGGQVVRHLHLHLMGGW